MELIFHDIYLQSDYAADPAAAPGRLDSILQTVQSDPGFYHLVKPEAAAQSDLYRAHDQAYVAQIKRDRKLYEMAALAAGGAITAAELGWRGWPAFAVIRPPGHHASGGHCWGFCFFNNDDNDSRTHGRFAQEPPAWDISRYMDASLTNSER